MFSFILPITCMTLVRKFRQVYVCYVTWTAEVSCHAIFIKCKRGDKVGALMETILLSVNKTDCFNNFWAWAGL